MTMAEIVVEKAVCGKCGAAVRDESLFCYNCGGAVAAESIVDTATEPVTAAAAVTEPKERPPLTSAASLRKHRRAANRQRLEVTWERPDGTPVAFVVGTIVLTIGALVLLLLAGYLR